MNFGRAQVQLEAECPIDIDLRFAKISGKEDICFDGNQIKFTVENGVNVEIKGLIVNIIGNEAAETKELSDANMGRAATYLGKVPFSGEIRQVKIIPKVNLNDEEQICQEKALIAENLSPC